MDFLPLCILILANIEIRGQGLKHGQNLSWMHGPAPKCMIIDFVIMPMNATSVQSMNNM